MNIFRKLLYFARVTLSKLLLRYINLYPCSAWFWRHVKSPSSYAYRKFGAPRFENKSLKRLSVKAEDLSNEKGEKRIQWLRIISRTFSPKCIPRISAYARMFMRPNKHVRAISSFFCNRCPRPGRLDLSRACSGPPAPEKSYLLTVHR